MHLSHLGLVIGQSLPSEFLLPWSGVSLPVLMLLPSSHIKWGHSERVTVSAHSLQTQVASEWWDPDSQAAVHELLKRNLLNYYSRAGSWLSGQERLRTSMRIWVQIPPHLQQKSERPRACLQGRGFRYLCHKSEDAHQEAAEPNKARNMPRMYFVPWPAGCGVS